MASWPLRRFTAADDRGASYQIGFRGGHAAGELLLRPDLPHQTRWLDLITAPGEPATRIDLAPQVPAPAVTVTRNAHGPGELLLDVIAARILTSAAPFPQDNPEQLAAAKAELRALATDGPVTSWLRCRRPTRCPGQLAGLCARLGISGHGITAPPAADLPEPWHSLLTRYHRRKPQAGPAPGILAATAAGLPERDVATIAILGLHHGEPGSILHMLASGVTPEDDWA
jgi:hypothetical protein